MRSTAEFLHTRRCAAGIGRAARSGRPDLGGWGSVAGMADLESQIQDSGNSGTTRPDDAEAAVVHAAIDLLDRGEARVAELGPDGEPIVHEWCKQAVLLLFRVSALSVMEAGPFEYVDRLPLKRDYRAAGVRVVPGASARWGSFLEPGVILMPSYVNIGARVGSRHHGRYLGHRRQLRPGRPQHPPVRGRRHRRRAGAAAGRPGLRRRRVLHRQPEHGRRGGPGRRRGGARGRLHPERHHSGHRRRDAARSCREVSCPPWCVAVPATRTRSYPGGEFGLPCVLVIRRLEPGERHDKCRLNDILRQHGGTL